MCLHYFCMLSKVRYLKPSHKFFRTSAEVPFSQLLSNFVSGLLDQTSMGFEYGELPGQFAQKRAKHSYVVKAA